MITPPFPHHKHQLLPLALRLALRRHHVRPSPHILTINLGQQRVYLWRQCPGSPLLYITQPPYRASTSAFGIGQELGSNQTPLGLHRVAAKVGGGMPIGTVFRHRRPIGLTWQGLTEASIVHRILWLEGLEPGFNRGGSVDTFERYIYIHGFADETTLGRPKSHGCVHMAAADLIPLYDRIPIGTLVWIERGSV